MVISRFLIILAFSVFIGTLILPAYAYVAPLKQVKAGFDSYEVICREGFVLMKRSNESTACFKEENIHSVEIKGWKTITPSNSIMISQEDNEKTIFLAPSQKFLLNLSDFYDWKIDIDDMAVVHVFQFYEKQKDIQGIYEAHVTGKAVLSAVGDPYCLRAEPACKIASTLFTIEIEVDGESSPSHMQMANPASVYCQENGGRLEIRETEIGQQGVCVFSNGKECDEWKYFRGECSQ